MAFHARGPHFCRNGWPSRRPAFSFSSRARQLSALLPSRSKIPASSAEIAIFPLRKSRPIHLFRRQRRHTSQPRVAQRTLGVSQREPFQHPFTERISPTPVFDRARPNRPIQTITENPPTAVTKVAPSLRTLKALHIKAQGRAAHPGCPAPIFNRAKPDRFLKAGRRGRPRHAATLRRLQDAGSALGLDVFHARRNRRIGTFRTGRHDAGRHRFRSMYAQRDDDGPRRCLNAAGVAHRSPGSRSAPWVKRSDRARFLVTPQALHIKAQGRAAHPG